MAVLLSAGQYFGAVSRETPTAAFGVSEIAHRGRRTLPPHGHEPAYFSMLISGAYRERCGRHELDYRPFQIGFHPPETWHEDEVGVRGATFFCLEVDASFLVACDMPGLSRALEEPRFLDSTATVLATRAHAERAAGTLSPLALEGYGWELLATVGARTTTEVMTPAWLRRSIEVIHSSIGTGTTIGGLAQEVSVHPVHLARTFRRRFGRTVAQHLEQLRIEAACRLLASNTALADIASQTGFADQSHFTRTFTRRVGVSPGRYRRVLATQ
jgi:AraC family transcriptional regulator